MAVFRVSSLRRASSRLASISFSLAATCRRKGRQRRQVAACERMPGAHLNFRPDARRFHIGTLAIQL
jgi:hypothetical protein